MHLRWARLHRLLEGTTSTTLSKCDVTHTCTASSQIFQARGGGSIKPALMVQHEALIDESAIDADGRLHLSQLMSYRLPCSGSSKLRKFRRTRGRGMRPIPANEMGSQCGCAKGTSIKALANGESMASPAWR
eukprot:scaffold207100_cov35-Tisochrysis_lutea.AAC.2